MPEVGSPAVAGSFTQFSVLPPFQLEHQGQPVALPLPQPVVSPPSPPPSPPPPPPQDLPAGPLPIGRRPVVEDMIGRHDLGRMTALCEYCNAFHWIDERLSKSSKRSPKFGKCCSSGKVELPILQPPPHPLNKYLEEQTSDAKHFRDNIRRFNMAFAFTSLGVKPDEALLQGGGGPYVFKIQGALYHQHGSLIPYSNTAKPSYAQLYIYDSTEALRQRSARNITLRSHILSELQEMMLICNPFVAVYCQAMEHLRSQPVIPDVRFRLTYKPHQDA